MGVYIGYVQKVDNGNIGATFFNYKPIAEIRDEQFYPLTLEDLEVILPESKKHNINLTYTWSDALETEIVNKIFDNYTLAVVEFELSDLEDNFSNSGERNATGYKLQAVNCIKKGQIRRIHTAGAFDVITKDRLDSDFYNDAIVDISPKYAIDGDFVFVELDEIWAGPYEVGYRTHTNSFYIKPQLKENKYIVSGYSKDDMNIKELPEPSSIWGFPSEIWTVACPKNNAQLIQMDVITEAVLLESFRECTENSKGKGSNVDFSDIPSLLEKYEESLLSGKTLSEEIRHNRLAFLKDILTSKENIDEMLSSVTDSICDLLVKYQDSDSVKGWIQQLIEKNPELLDNFKDLKIVSSRISTLEQQLFDMQKERTELEGSIEASRQSANLVKKYTLEDSKEVIENMSEEHKILVAKIEEAQDRLKSIKEEFDVAGSMLDLDKKVKDLEGHYNYLSGATQGLEAEFQNLISKTREKMVGVAFDGFMANKMLQAAAKWESEENENNLNQIVNKVNAISAKEKSPKELIDYLCQMVRIVRPTYDKNTILNIAICMTQGFLTIFSGEPGCGKTSICNIFAEVLGLNKIPEMQGFGIENEEGMARYVAVSVERGWTSKRDFVGYYNPLSKTFDRSNRQVFDALRQLDIEKSKGISKFPFLILLDEANLSPMEYYWSDFMNVCDDLGPSSDVNLGEDYVYGIPETLHFVATINNDHTTETVSPRLIDRAWIVSLPEQYNIGSSEETIPSSHVEIIPWESLKSAFVPKREECEFTLEVHRIYNSIIQKLREKHISVSPRIDRAIRQYWGAASKHFEMDETKTSAEIVAMDYAIAQRILPKIAGNGEDFEKWLLELRGLCSNSGLNMSAKILRDIIERGNQRMKYYQFFY